MKLIKLNKGGLKWQAQNGKKIIAVGTKQECQLAVLKYDCPEIHKAVAEIIEFTDIIPFDGGLPRNGKDIKKRTIRAGFILRDGLLQPPRPVEERCHHEEVAWCKYWATTDCCGCSIANHNNRLVCDCPDWVEIAPRFGRGSTTQVTCEHVMAYLIKSGQYAEILENLAEEELV